MRNISISIFVLLVVALTLVASRARAWDGPEYWFESADGPAPGAGGIVATGGASDHNITCANCHIKGTAAQQIDLRFTSNPPMQAGGYRPGKTYQVNVDMVGEHLGLSGCSQYTSNTNNFAASFEDASGKPVGALTGDSGWTSSRCAPTMDPRNP